MDTPDLNKDDFKFAVVAETDKYDKPLLVVDLTLDKLLEDVVVPFNSDEPFYIDGVPLTAPDVKRIKILLQKDDFSEKMNNLHLTISNNSGNMHRAAERKLAIGEYPMRVEGIVRVDTEDITSQVVRAYMNEIRPSAANTGEFIEKRDTLVEKTKEAIVHALVGIGSAWIMNKLGLPGNE